MRDSLRHFPVNWINGMKINKDHLIAQDDAYRDSLNDIATLSLSPIRYGILPPSAAGEDTFNLKTSFDNQDTLRITILNCNAITPGGARIILPAMASAGFASSDGMPSVSFQLPVQTADVSYWIVLTVNPYERQPAGSPDNDDSTQRYPFTLPFYSLQLVSDNSRSQYANHPYALIIGQVLVQGKEVKVDDNYIPPCFSVSSHPDLIALHSEIDRFLGDLENRCSQIVQKIFRKNQQNDLSELVKFFCDHIVLYLGQAITEVRWTVLHESPALLFIVIVKLARVMKNSIDLRIGSGKEEMMNYLCEWCELKQGELETMLSNIASLRYDNNDINRNIEKVVTFARVISKLFETLSKLDFIGKKRESGIFVKEEPMNNTETLQKVRRRFFG